MTEEKHKIVYRNENNIKTTFYLNIPTDYTFGGENEIIIKENATGNGAVIINNGCKQEDININGTLFAVRSEEGYDEAKSKIANTFQGIETLNSNIETLNNLREDRRIIEFIGPFFEEGSNSWFIEDFKVTVLNDENSADFTMKLTENRFSELKSVERVLTLSNSYVDSLINAVKLYEGLPDEEEETEIGFGDWGEEELQWNLDKRDFTSVEYWKTKYNLVKTDLSLMKQNALESNLGPIFRAIEVLLTPFSAQAFKSFIQKGNDTPKPVLLELDVGEI